MLKQNNKETNEIMEQNAIEGGTHGNNNGLKKENCSAAHGTSNTGHRGGTDGKVTEKSSNNRKTPKESSSALVTTTNKRHRKERGVTNQKLSGLPTTASKPDLNKFSCQIPTLNSIPISGYTTFQQIDCYKGYFYFNQYMMEDQLSIQHTRVCQGSTSAGPFPFYEEIPLVKNLMTSLMLKCYDDYIPTASTNTTLPLTVSP